MKDDLSVGPSSSRVKWCSRRCDHRDRVCSDSLFIPDKPQSLMCCRLDGDLLHGDLEGVGNVLTHQLGVGGNPRLLEDNGRIDIHHREAMLCKQIRNMLQEDKARDAFVPGVGIGKMLPDVSQRRSPEQRVTDGMEQDVGIGVTFKSQPVWYFHSAEDELSVRYQPVDVVSESNTVQGLNGSTLSRSGYNGPLSV